MHQSDLICMLRRIHYFQGNNSQFFTGNCSACLLKVIKKGKAEPLLVHTEGVGCGPHGILKHVGSKIVLMLGCRRMVVGLAVEGFFNIHIIYCLSSHARCTCLVKCPKALAINPSSLFFQIMSTSQGPSNDKSRLNHH